MNIHMTIGMGEAFDKLTILEIKKEKISDPDKLKNIEKELEYTKNMVLNLPKFESEDSNTYIHKLVSLLKTANEMLWTVEDELREKERKQEFDHDFIVLARNVYFINDKRAELKKLINLTYSSDFIEEKSYAKY
jgi:hypothetical protein